MRLPWTSIENYTFYNCRSLISIDIPENVTSIGSNAFYYCSSLTSVVIPDSVTSIHSSAFLGCSSLTSIVIGKGVKLIGSGAFMGCSSLTTVICRAEELPEFGWGIFEYVWTSEATLYVPASALEAYKAAYPWKEFGTILPLAGDADGIGSPALQDKTDNASYYTLDGKSVTTPTRKGIYVRNGKKTIVK